MDVWFYQFGDRPVTPGVAPGFLETMEGREEIVASLQMIAPDGTGTKTLCRSISGVKKFSAHKNINPVLWKTASFAPRMLAQLHTLGARAFQRHIAQNEHPEFYVGPCYPAQPVSNWQMLKIARTIWVAFCQDDLELPIFC